MNREEIIEEALINGINKHFGKSGTVTVLAKVWKRDELVAAVQGRLDKTEAAREANAEWRRLTKAKKAYLAETEDLVLALKTHLLTMFQGDDRTLEDFGLIPKVRKRLSAEERAEAVKKARATREARKKGGIDATAPTPAPTPTPSPSPAPSASPTVTQG